MSLALDNTCVCVCVSPSGGEAKELERNKLADHEQGGHMEKYRPCPACQVADVPLVRQLGLPREDEGFHVLHMDLSGPYTVAERQAGRGALHAAVAALRTQNTGPRRSLLLPWGHTMRPKEHGETLDVAEAILGEKVGRLCSGYRLRVARHACRHIGTQRG